MASLTALPPELYIEIIGDLSCLDVLALRRTCRHLYTSLSPNHKHLLEVETLPGAKSRNLKACAACLQLLHSSRFAKKMRHPPPPPYMDLIPYDFVSASMAIANPVARTWENRKGTPPEQRFCNDCGAKDLPGKYRYHLGERWDGDFGTWYVRCVRCEKVRVAQAEKGAKVCFGCHLEEEEDERMLEKHMTRVTVEEDEGVRTRGASQL